LNYSAPNTHRGKRENATATRREKKTRTEKKSNARAKKKGKPRTEKKSNAPRKKNKPRTEKKQTNSPAENALLFAPRPKRKEKSHSAEIVKTVLRSAPGRKRKEASDEAEKQRPSYETAAESGSAKRDQMRSAVETCRLAQARPKKKCPMNKSEDTRRLQPAPPAILASGRSQSAQRGLQYL
jgi:hypothetical protein